MSKEPNQLELEVPAPTSAPLFLAFGLTLVAAGFLTAGPVLLLGVVLVLAGAVGWFRAALPTERCVLVPVDAEVPPVVTAYPTVERSRRGAELHRARLPLETYPIGAGIKGGIVGGVAMAVLAGVYGLVSHGSLWYPLNLLAAGLLPALRDTTAELTAFHAEALAIGLGLHALTSLLVGTLYGMLLPMFSWRPSLPILVGGLGAPLLWSALLYPSIGMINPVLAARIDWGWFIASQLAFGLAAGLVVSRSTRIRTS